MVKRPAMMKMKLAKEPVHGLEFDKSLSDSKESP